MMKTVLKVLLFFLVTGPATAQIVNPATTRGDWYYCVARAASHTGRYTFRISQKPCEVYWLEIDTTLEIRDCELPVIAAIKPSATDRYSIVWFHMGTGAFYDYLSGVKDRGLCKPVDTPKAYNK